MEPLLLDVTDEDSVAAAVQQVPFGAPQLSALTLRHASRRIQPPDLYPAHMLLNTSSELVLAVVFETRCCAQHTCAS